MNNSKIPNVGLIVKAEVQIKEKDTDKVVYEGLTSHKDGMIKLPDNVPLDEDKEYVGLLSVTTSNCDISYDTESIVKRGNMILSKKD